MKNRGFSLIETLIAMMILSGAFLVLTNSWNGSLLAIRKSRNLSTVSYLLQKKTTELELKYKDKNPEEVPEDENGDFGSDFPNYTWKMKTEKLKMPDMSATLTSRDGGATEMELMIMKKVQEFIEKSVKEMRVSIVWKSGKRDVEYSVSTYLVDYSQSVGL